jgi:hypothetical protein
MGKPILQLCAICVLEGQIRAASVEAEGLSILDAETRLDTIGLGREAAKATAGGMKLDRSIITRSGFRHFPRRCEMRGKEGVSILGWKQVACSNTASCLSRDFV